MVKCDIQDYFKEIFKDYSKEDKAVIIDALATIITSETSYTRDLELLIMQESNFFKLIIVKAKLQALEGLK